LASGALTVTRRVPIFATTVVLVAVAIMIALGFWQLGRKAEKEALLARYEQVRGMSAAVSWPRSPDAFPAALYRRSRIDCARVVSMEPVSGRSNQGRAGWAQIAHCRLLDGGLAKVAIGWSPRPEPVLWSGGEVSGIVGPAGKSGIRLVAAPAQAGLEPLAAPDPSNLPNNHLSYAVQWFAFAATALVIYLLALRRRWSASSSN
jgi:surfeit locus 1 family protein